MTKEKKSEKQKRQKSKKKKNEPKKKKKKQDKTKKLEKKYSTALDNYGQSCFVRSDLKKMNDSPT